MSTTDEIKELAEIICIDCAECDDCEWGRGKCECVLREARMLYNEGYRKIKEGKWILKDDGRAHCSECDTPGMAYMWKYCPECGARMMED